MKIKQIKEFINKGIKVYWKNTLYEVKQNKGYYYIECVINGFSEALINLDTNKLMENEKDFFMREGVD